MLPSTNNVRETLKQRHKPYVLLIEKLPVWVVIILFFLCSAVAAAFIAISFFTPSPKASQSLEYSAEHPPQVPFSDVFTKSSPLYFDANNLAMANQEITMELVLMPRVLAENKTDQYQFSIFKEDLKVGIELTGHRGDPERAETIFKSADVSTRILFCPQREKTCRPVFLAHLPFVAYSHYKLGVRILNADDLYRDKLLNDYIKVEFHYFSSDFAAWSIGWRYALLFVALPALIGMVVYQLIRQKPSAWKTEQKASVVLLALLVLYNNPLYILDYLFPIWIFSLINYIFMVTFVSYLLYLGLVLAHSIIRLPKDRSYTRFYLPKVLLSGAIWLVAIIVLCYTRIQAVNDPAYMLYEDIQAAHTVLFYFTLAVVLIYVSTMLYYLFRACGFCLSKQLPRRYAPKFVAVFLFIFILMIASLVDVLLFAMLQSNNGAQFLSFFALYNVFSIFLGVLFLPTFTVDEKKIRQQKERADERPDSMEHGNALAPEEGGHIVLEEEDYFDDDRNVLADEYKPEEDHEWE